MNLRDIILIEIASHRMTNTMMTPPIEETTVVKILETKLEQWVSAAGGGGMGSYYFMDMEFQFGKMKSSGNGYW